MEKPTVEAEAEDRLEQIHARLRTAVRHACPHRLADHADDIVQLATIRLLELAKKSGGLEERKPSYLKAVAYSIVVDEIRRRYRRREITVGDGPAMETNPAPVPDPERLAGASELGRGIVGCLRRLRDPRRRAVALHLQGYTIPEVAVSLGFTVKKTEHLAHRGIADLRQCLARKGLQP
jgi:RNA polymerase sigma factor (sigma-70 family)